MLPWFCQTKEKWWEGTKLMKYGIKWFSLVTIANDGFAVCSAVSGKFYYKKDGISLGDLVSMVLAYLLLVYSFFKGYMAIASAIIIANNFVDMFLYAYGLLALKETTKSFEASVLQSCLMLVFMILFAWVKFINSPKILYSILMEAPQCGEVDGWIEWNIALVLVGGMEIVYLHWLALLLVGVKRAF